MALGAAPSLLLRNGAMRSITTRCLSVTPCVLGKFPKSFDTSMGAHGPLINGPDYTFLDGRPTPLRIGQRKRALKQREVSAKVLQLLKETKFAIEHHKKLQDEEQQKKHDILASKLKPKGQALLHK
ncbi:39S ribosomal protein L52, mitochondrial-like [Homarus americanus]